MGYYTNYNLDIERYDDMVGCGHEFKKEDKFCPVCGRNLLTPFSIDEAVINFYDSEIGDYNFSDFIQGDGEDCKWYSHEDDMKKISKKFIGYLFTLEGEGEESGDVWKKYYLNGKCQIAKAKISIAPFDKSKLE